MPASCSPSVTDPEHPAQPRGTRLVMQPGMQRPPASTLPEPAPGACPQRPRPGVACLAGPEAQQARMPRLQGTWQTIRQDVSATRPRSLLSRANVPHCLALYHNTVAYVRSGGLAMQTPRTQFSSSPPRLQASFSVQQQARPSSQTLLKLGSEPPGSSFSLVRVPCRVQFPSHMQLRTRALYQSPASRRLR